jgi:hypothetical protein
VKTPQNLFSQLPSVRPGVREQRPGDCGCEKPSQCTKDQEPDQPADRSKDVHRDELVPDNGVQPFQVAGSQEYAPGSDFEHVTARAVGPVHPYEEETIASAISQADQAGQLRLSHGIPWGVGWDLLRVLTLPAATDAGNTVSHK